MPIKASKAVHKTIEQERSKRLGLNCYMKEFIFKGLLDSNKISHDMYDEKNAT